MRGLLLAAWILSFVAPSAAFAQARVIDLNGNGEAVVPPTAGPQPANSAAYRAGMRALGDNPKAAANAFRQCITPNRQGAKCYRGLAQAYAQTGMPALAATNYRMYLKVLPGAPDTAVVKRLIREADAAAAQQQADQQAQSRNVDRAPVY